jgi:hypothetical protein
MRPAPPSHPAAAPAPVEEAPAAKVVAKPKAATAKPSVDPSVDDEQRKALKALQESQLESTF